MTTINYNNAHLVDVLDCNGETLLCWVDRETGDVLREFDETDLEITSDYVKLWDAGRETVVGAWVDSTGKIVESSTKRPAKRKTNLLWKTTFCSLFNCTASRAGD